MVTPTYAPDRTRNTPIDDHHDMSLINDDPHLKNATLSPQTSTINDPKTVADMNNVIDKLSKQTTQSVRQLSTTQSVRQLSMYRSDSNSTVKTTLRAYDDVTDFIPIEPELYMSIVNGVRDRVLEMDLYLCGLKCKEDENSVLHIAACAGQDQLIRDIVPMCKDITGKNLKGDLAFHCAAKSAQLNALKALMDWDNYDVEARASSAVLRKTNEVGDTALHIALENNQGDMALCLVNECPEACYVLNNNYVCPLYMAVELGYWDLVNRMMEYTEGLEPGLVDALMTPKSIVHAAIDAENTNFLEKILITHGNLINSLDDKGRTPLSYAAFKGYLPGVLYLYENFPELAYKRNEDENGSFPIHQAASGGHVKIITKLYTTKQLLNMKGQSILHVAARDGKAKVVSCLLKKPELMRFVNLKDEDGNTPLHLASRNFQPRVVYVLTREQTINHGLKNKDGLTALDLAEIHAEPLSSYEVRLTWMALRYVNAPQSSQSTRQTYCELEGEDLKNTKENEKSELENITNRTNTFMVVATLVATITFAAGFTAPGGYNQDGPDIGMAVLTDKWAFQVFTICNTAALFSSILSVVSLIWAYTGDLKVLRVSLKFSLPLLGFALTMMSLAFMMGLFVVLRTLPWLSYVVVGVGFVFLLGMLVLFIPLYSPSNIRNPVARFFFTGSFLLLLLVCERSKIK